MGKYKFLDSNSQKITEFGDLGILSCQIGNSVFAVENI